MSALDGIRVLELGQFYFAPYCAMLLARMGADVIKIESPAGDPYRKLPTQEITGVAVQFGFVNSGKRNVCINLRTPEGADVLRRLARNVDVIVQNLAPGALDRFGVGWDVLSQENPRLILGSGTGFGSFGPYAGEPAMDLTIQARTAVMSTTGFEDGAPVRTGPSVVDFMAGAHMSAGILAALVERSVTGRGQHVEVSLQDAIIPSLSSNFAGYISSGGTMPERTGNHNGGLAVTPYNSYEAADGWLTILCPTDAHWDRLVALIDDDAFRDPRFATNASRCVHMDVVDALLSRWTSNQKRDELCDRLREINVLCAPVVTLGELLEDPHVRAHGVIRQISEGERSWWAFGSPIFMSDSPLVEPTRPAARGQHTDAVLREELHLSDSDINDLRARGAVE